MINILKPIKITNASRWSPMDPACIIRVIFFQVVHV